ncbi:peptidyl-prolyl cis-trans isomerase D [Ferroglobus placidus DSM 10642]|uniref:Peptidyl-prolyl cis-trans isomerase D n=1 Tax=Ferroglobus placidus (strain DSM 10642 / AEDII12DO) TaxID=589924 RepID=D3S0K6_FERPA|nr:peptidyl-prolyl cis-trans isomerase D [Ferroglobus placidus DSM 10642]
MKDILLKLFKEKEFVEEEKAKEILGDNFKKF